MMNPSTSGSTISSLVSSGSAICRRMFESNGTQSKRRALATKIFKDQLPENFNIIISISLKLETLLFQQREHLSQPLEKRKEIFVLSVKCVQEMLAQPEKQKDFEAITPKEHTERLFGAELFQIRLSNDKRIFLAKQKLLGEGGHNQVFLGIDILNVECFALRLLSNKANAKKLREEHTIHQQLLSNPRLQPSIVKIHAIFESKKGMGSLQMFCNGGTLLQAIQDQTLNFSSKKLVFRKILEFLRDLHAAGCIYGDLKAGNVLLHSGASGLEVIIVDFGGAHLERERKLELSPRSCPPELFPLGSSTTKQSDIWMAGLIACLLQLGDIPPFIVEAVAKVDNFKGNACKDIKKVQEAQRRIQEGLVDFTKQHPKNVFTLAIEYFLRFDPNERHEINDDLLRKLGF